MQSFAILSAFVALSWAYTMPAEVAAPLVLRQAPPGSSMSSTVTTVITQIDSFSTTVDTYSGSSDSYSQIETTANSFISIIETSTFTISNITAITSQDASEMQQLVARYNAAGDGLRSRFDNKVAVFTNSCQCQSTLTFINQLSTQTQIITSNVTLLQCID